MKKRLCNIKDFVWNSIAGFSGGLSWRELLISVQPQAAPVATILTVVT